MHARPVNQGIREPAGAAATAMEIAAAACTKAGMNPASADTLKKKHDDSIVRPCKGCGEEVEGGPVPELTADVIYQKAIWFTSTKSLQAI